MVGFFPIEKFQMKVATGLIYEALEELSCEAKTESTSHVLLFFRRFYSLKRQFIQPPPDQIGPAAEINHATGQAFIHRHVGLAAEWVARIERKSVAANSPFIAQCLQESLSQGDSTVLD